MPRLGVRGQPGKPWVRPLATAERSARTDAVSVVAPGGERHRPEVLRKALALPVAFLSGRSGGGVSVAPAP